VAVTDHILRWVVIAAAGLCAAEVSAGVLPEDRADALYHSYDGGGVEVNGPSLLVRKSLGQNVSVSARHYVDAISSASIDVVTTASPYEEERTENGLGVDYLAGDSTMSLNLTTSSENDYEAKTFAFSIGMDMFGDLTTVSLGYSVGQDKVGKTGQPEFSKDVDRQSYRLGLSQILTKDWQAELGLETITDEGFLNNPYRSVRYLDPASPKGYSYEPEVYPHTHTSNAVSIRTGYYLPWHASLKGEYRYFTDTWGIRAHNAEIGYTHPLGNHWTLDLSYRYYTQTAADFYADIFPRQQAQNYLARDKELSTFHSHTFGAAVSYLFEPAGWRFIDHGSLTASYDHMLFRYEDFRDLSAAGPAGEEPLYDFTASVMQLYLSIWY